MLTYKTLLPQNRSNIKVLDIELGWFALVTVN